MSLKYLSKLVSWAGEVNNLYSQMVAIDELDENQRCPWCYYLPYRQGGKTHIECQLAHHCTDKHFLFAALDFPANDDNAYQGNPMGPRQTRKITFESSPRYLQLQVPTQLDYQCATTCHYFASRMEKKQSIAACSSSHGCGRNGSWWQLGKIDYQYLFNMPDLSTPLDDPSRVITLAGTEVDFSGGATIQNSGNIIEIIDGDNHHYLMVDMFPPSDKCGKYLTGNLADDPSTWGFTNFIYPTSINRYIPIVSRHDFIYDVLLAHGMSPSQF